MQPDLSLHDEQAHLQPGSGRIPAESISESTSSAGTGSGSSHTARMGVDALRRLRPGVVESAVWDARHRGYAAQADGPWACVLSLLPSVFIRMILLSIRACAHWSPTRAQRVALKRCVGISKSFAERLLGQVGTDMFDLVEKFAVIRCPLRVITEMLGTPMEERVQLNALDRAHSQIAGDGSAR